MEKYCTAGKPQMTIWRMFIACYIPKATDTVADYVQGPAEKLEDFKLK